MSNPSSFRKKTRRHEDDQDLRDFLAGVALTGEAREKYIFDNVDVAEVANYMATMAVTQDIDGTDKNYFIYRDTEGTREWQITPWDIDLTFGPDALNTDNIVFDQQNIGGRVASHPLIGTRPYTLSPGKYPGERV